MVSLLSKEVKLMIKLFLALSGKVVFLYWKKLYFSVEVFSFCEPEGWIILPETYM